MPPDGRSAAHPPGYGMDPGTRDPLVPADGRSAAHPPWYVRTAALRAAFIAAFIAVDEGQLGSLA